MNHKSSETYFCYWGKASPEYAGEPKWHPAAYHSLDVAAVAATWWDEGPVIQRIFLTSFNWPESEAKRLRAWVLFFVTLHDLGKFDIRFQLKAPKGIAAAWPEFDAESHGLSVKEIKRFDHGWTGIA